MISSSARSLSLGIVHSVRDCLPNKGYKHGRIFVTPEKLRKEHADCKIPLLRHWISSYFTELRIRLFKPVEGNLESLSLIEVIFKDCFCGCFRLCSRRPFTEVKFKRTRLRREKIGSIKAKAATIVWISLQNRFYLVFPVSSLWKDNFKDVLCQSFSTDPQQQGDINKFSKWSPLKKHPSTLFCSCSNAAILMVLLVLLDLEADIKSTKSYTNPSVTERNMHWHTLRHFTSHTAVTGAS